MRCNYLTVFIAISEQFELNHFEGEQNQEVIDKIIIKNLV